MSNRKIFRDSYTVVLEEPELYVDNESRRRSGHMSHAMAKFDSGCFIDFNANNSALRYEGHFPYGWVEYRVSKDSGKTYSEIHNLPYSVESFLDGIYTISVEKAVGCFDGTIVAFCLRNDAMSPVFCEPWHTPTVITSSDGGATWSEPREFTEYAGRIYDAIYHNGKIYVMLFCNERFLGSSPEHKYRIYTSSDNGKTFEELSFIPFDTLGRGYGSILFDADGKLHAYIYNEKDEYNLDHAMSEDLGETWKILNPCYMAKKIRNPQTAMLDGIYIMHGRAGETSFVLYTSLNAVDWDEGYFLVDDGHGLCYYSNNLNLRDEKGEFLLIQYSSPYGRENLGAKVNVMHQKIRIKNSKYG